MTPIKVLVWVPASSFPSTSKDSGLPAKLASALLPVPVPQGNGILTLELSGSQRWLKSHTKLELPGVRGQHLSVMLFPATKPTSLHFFQGKTTYLCVSVCVCVYIHVYVYIFNTVIDCFGVLIWGKGGRAICWLFYILPTAGCALSLAS